MRQATSSGVVNFMYSLCLANGPMSMPKGWKKKRGVSGAWPCMCRENIDGTSTARTRTSVSAMAAMAALTRMRAASNERVILSDMAQAA